MTELEVYQSLIEAHGVRSMDKEEAKAALRQRIQVIPNWLYVLPESLLDKLGIKYDHQFDVKDIALAAAIGGRCERRLL
jgi:hypothetical protein